MSKPRIRAYRDSCQRLFWICGHGRFQFVGYIGATPHEAYTAWLSARMFLNCELAA